MASIGAPARCARTARPRAIEMAGADVSGADVTSLLRRAWAALQQGQPAPARADCETALQRAPDSFDAWRLYAVTLQALGEVWKLVRGSRAASFA